MTSARALRLPLGSLALLLASLPFALTAACSSEVTAAPAPTPKPTTAPTAPVTPAQWKDAPTSPIAMKQGIATRIPLTLSKEADVTVEGPEGVVGTREADALTLWADYSLKGPVSVHVKLTSGTAVADVPVSLEVAPIGWNLKQSWAKGQGPAGREHPSVFVDANSRVVYMLQGSGYEPQWVPIGDSWKFDLATSTWSSWEPQGDAPPPGLGRRPAGPAKDGTYLLIGGEIANEALDPELYRFDPAGGGRFKKLAQVNPPAGRTLHFAAMDSGLGKTVVFGGFSYDSQKVLNDTWIITTQGDTATWRKVQTPANATPSGRYGGFAALDETSHRYFVFSGAGTPKGSDMVNAAQDTWVFDMDKETWTLLETTGTSPTGRRNGCAMHDSVNGRLFVFGGTPNGRTTTAGLHVLDLKRATWSHVDVEGPHIRSSGAGFFDPKTGRVFCGFGNDDKVYLDTNALDYGP